MTKRAEGAALPPAPCRGAAMLQRSMPPAPGMPPGPAPCPLLRPLAGPRQPAGGRGAGRVVAG